MITIIDYGMGNLGSLLNMFKRIEVKAEVTNEIARIQAAEKILLPGVGAFDAAMRRINELGIRDTLEKRAKVDCIPILGICLGMQLLTRGSEEGKMQGLNWIAADTRRFPKLEGYKVPHMGWNVAEKNNPSELTRNLTGECRYYFVHSYCVHVDHAENSIMRTRHGIDFDSAVQSGNIYGAQFHPEKSHKFGAKFLANFAEL